MAFGNVKPLMQENVLGAPPTANRLRKKIFGKPVTPKTAKGPNPFAGSPSNNPFGKPSSVKPKNLFGRLTGK